MQVRHSGDPDLHNTTLYTLFLYGSNTLPEIAACVETAVVLTAAPEVVASVETAVVLTAAPELVACVAAAVVLTAEVPEEKPVFLQTAKKKSIEYSCDVF